MASGSGETGSGTASGAEAGSGNGTPVVEDRPGVSGMHLLLMCLDTERHVTFHESVIDNEGMNRRKSKCCCIYHMPHNFGESSSSSDDECEHCCGHPEVRLRNRLKKKQAADGMCQCKCHNGTPTPAPADEEPPMAAEVAGDTADVTDIKVDLETQSSQTTHISATSKAVKH